MSMIEIVARAIWNIQREEMDKCDIEFEDIGQSGNRYLTVDIARAAINALREPSDAMLAAGVIHDDATYSTWIAMIDCALGEG